MPAQFTCSGAARPDRPTLIRVLALAALLPLVLPACSKEGDAEFVDTGSAPTLSVLVVHSLPRTQVEDVGAKILSTGLLAAADAFDARDATPLLTVLQAYDVVLVVSNKGFDDRDALGDVLAEHIDTGGGVVLTMFAMSDPYDPSDQDSKPDTPGGRFEGANYYVISQSVDNGADDGPHGMTVLVPGHPILESVDSFEGGTRSYRPFGSVVAQGGTLVATWDDTETTPLIAVREIAGVRRADLGFYPVTSDGGLNFFGDPEGSGPRIVVNALRWVAGEI